MSGAPRYIYQRKGGPLVRWDRISGRPPGQARGADAKSMGGLGSLGSADPADDLASATVTSGAPIHAIRTNRRPLPQPGAPEYLSMGGDCGCHGESFDVTGGMAVALVGAAFYVGVGYLLAKVIGRAGA